MVSAYILINCVPGSEENILKGLSQVQGIKEVSGIYGDYDVIAKVEASDMSVLEEIVTSQIRRTPNVISTKTMLVIDSYSSAPYYDVS